MLSFEFDTEVFGEVKFPENDSSCLGVDARYKMMVHPGFVFFDVQQSWSDHPSLCVVDEAG